MKLAVLKERRNGETRVAATPETVKKYIGMGLEVAVENGAGRFGMPDPARVFTKFYRGEHAQARFGSGLGLSIAQHLATVLGGVIRYEPEAQTVRFAVELPC